MDERIEDIEPISSIRPTRKLAFPDYRGSEGQKYQFTRSKKKLAKEKIQRKLASESNPDELGDLKKRIMFDRAMIIGD
jgi:hypothetical protein